MCISTHHPHTRDMRVYVRVYTCINTYVYINTSVDTYSKCVRTRGITYHTQPSPHRVSYIHTYMYLSDFMCRHHNNIYDCAGDTDVGRLEVDAFRSLGGARLTCWMLSASESEGLTWYHDNMLMGRDVSTLGGAGGMRFRC